MEDSWKSTEFVVLPHRDSKDVFILGGTDDIQVLLDDSQVWRREGMGGRRGGGGREEGRGWEGVRGEGWGCKNEEVMAEGGGSDGEPRGGRARATTAHVESADMISVLSGFLR